MTIVPASALSVDDLLSVFNAAYASYYYPIYLTRHSFQDLVAKEHVDLDSSVAAIANHRAVGLGLLGMRGSRGWVGGMGVIPDYRRKGIARRMLKTLIDEARMNRLNRLVLEVIVDNVKAIILYKENGFITERELIVLTLSGNRVATGETLPEGITIRALDDLSLEATQQRQPCAWQREIYAGNISDLAGMAAYWQGAGTPVGVCLFSCDGNRGSIYELTGDNTDIGMGLLNNLLDTYPQSGFTYLNVDEKDPLLHELYRAGFSDYARQYEMALQLT
nr:GNAT family N-acetyltransferase [Anaerolineae bacterium]